jgi:hypothetical protein
MTLTNLRSSVRFTIFGDSTNTSYGNTDLDRNLNLWYKTVLSWILPINGDWQVNGEVATTNLVAGQREYILPADILKLNEVYVMSGGVYLKAKQIDPKVLTGEPDQSSFGYNPSTPAFDLRDNSIFIYTDEDSIGEATAGLKIHYQTTFTDLVNTTDEPNLSEPFERILISGSAYEYCVANEMRSKSEQMKRDIQELKRDLEQFYATRSTVKKTRIIPKNEDNY